MHGWVRARRLESYTTQFALRVLASGLYDHRHTARPVGDLFKWHMLEEVEHRNVAFDVYEHLYGDYLYRAGVCWVAQHHMFRFIADCAQLMSSVDTARHGENCRITIRQKVLMARSRPGMRARTMLPGYTPHKYAIPAEDRVPFGLLHAACAKYPLALRWQIMARTRAGEQRADLGFTPY